MHLWRIQVGFHIFRYTTGPIMKSDHSRTLDTLRLGDRLFSSMPFTAPARPPSDCDLDKLKRGQLFFQRNVSSCIFAMLSSLVCGLSIPNLLNPLLFTNQSDTAQKSLQRYIRTLVHVITWHLSDIYEPDSPAHKSLVKVRTMHNHVAKAMTAKQQRAKKMIPKEDSAKIHVSQYDLSLVQCGFVGAIIMHPESFALGSNIEDLDDYVYLWKYIGMFLGIADDNNVCFYGYHEAYKLCKQIEDGVLLPAMQNPPEDFGIMAKAFTDGLNILSVLKVYTPEAVVNFVLDVMGQPRQRQSILNELRIRFFKLGSMFMWYIPGCRRGINTFFMWFYRRYNI